MPLISVKDLSIGYSGKPVAEHIDFQVDEGDFLCIIGENGSGKSTLVKTLLRLQSEISGDVQFEGLQGSRGIGYLPQQTEVQRDFPASVKEIVLSGCQGRCGIRPFYRREEKQLADDNIARMGITDLKNRCYRELSGGQQQRVLLARALCAADRILLLDEPVTGLDPKATKEMYELIRKLNSEGVTILMISHDVEAAVAMATHILHMGKPPFFGSREEYLKSRQWETFQSQKGGAI